MEKKINSPNATKAVKKTTKVVKKASSSQAKKTSDKKNQPQESFEASTKKLMKVVIIGSAACLGMVVANLGMIWHLNSSKSEVIAITETGQVINPIPLPQAFVNDARVLSFVDSCLRDSFSHDFENYRRTVNAAMGCYTVSGGVEFKKALEESLEIIRSRRLVMSITMEPPSLVRGPYLAGGQRGRAAWDVQTIITISYQGARERYAPKRFRANVTVHRVQLEENLTGISVNSIQLRTVTN